MKRLSAIIALLFIIGLSWRWLAISSDPSAAESNSDIKPGNVVPRIDPQPHHPGVSPQDSKSALDDKRPNSAERMAKAFAIPITFYGRVLDQTGTPVAGAKVRGSAAFSMGGDTIKTAATTDASGNFTLNSRGMSLFVSVDKPDYYRIYPNRLPGMVSENSFDYADLGSGVHKPGSRNLEADPSDP